MSVLLQILPMKLLLRRLILFELDNRAWLFQDKTSKPAGAPIACQGLNRPLDHHWRAACFELLEEGFIDVVLDQTEAPTFFFVPEELGLVVGTNINFNNGHPAS